MTQPAELDWSCRATTITWRRKLWDSHSLSMIKYTTFSLDYFHPLFTFSKIAQYNRFNFNSSYGRR